MKLKIVIDKDKEEEIVIFAHEKTELIKSIEELIENNNFSFIGYNDKGAHKLVADEIYCFISEKGKTFAITEKYKLLVRSRLYQIEPNLDKNFVRLNQSCIANINKMKRFETEISGSLTIVFKNGYKDYVSRRQLKVVKERIGI